MPQLSLTDAYAVLGSRFESLPDLYDKGIAVHKHTDPISEAASDIELELAEEVVTSDPSLLWVNPQGEGFLAYLESAHKWK